jgi:diguanylate cyclase
LSNEAVKTARAALHLLTTRGLPPTPESYSHVFREVLGEPSDYPAASDVPLTAEQKLDNSRDLADLIRTLVAAVAEKAGDLADNLSQQSQEMQKSISELEQAEERQEISNLLKIVLATAHAIQNSVDDAQEDISLTRREFDEMRAELEVARRQVMIDPLTGARNRFGMEASLGQEVARARRAGSHLAVAMLDLDHFKEVNDNHGHDAGDQLLIYFAQLSNSVLRESDTLYRCGGEEFLVTLPETELHGAAFMLSRLRRMLAKSPLKYQGTTIKLTFSGGVAGLNTEDTDQTLMTRADQMLYRAKRQGRDRIIADRDAA